MSRVVKLIWNQKLGLESDYSIETEIIIGEGDDPEQAGAEAMRFVNEFQNGAIQYAKENG